MDAVNAAMAKVFALMWAPFAGMPPWVGLLVIGVAFGVLALIAMKYCSNQKAVEATKTRYQGHILAIKLFRDSFSVVISSLVKTLGWIGMYLGHQFKPVLVMIIPFSLLFAQMQVRLAYRPLPVGQRVLVDVVLDPAQLKATKAAELDIRAEVPSGLFLVHAPVRAFQPATDEAKASAHAVFDFEAKAPGTHLVQFTCDGRTQTKRIDVGEPDGNSRVSPTRSNSFEDRLLFPTESSFDAGSPFASISLVYPVRRLDFLGFDLSFGSEYGMMIVFIAITIVAALAFKDLFGVTI